MDIHEYLNKLLEWESEGLGRQVRIEVHHDYKNNRRISVNYWDNDEGKGAYADYPELPDIEKYNREKELKELAKLKAKYEKNH